MKQRLERKGVLQTSSSADLRWAIDEHELMLYHQPKFDCADEHTVVGVEALIRWNHPQMGVLLPGCVLPLAENAHLLTEVTDFTITEAIRQHASWRNQSIDLPIAVNLAPELISDAGIPERLLDSLGEFDVPAARLTWQLEETEIFGGPRFTREAMPIRAVHGQYLEEFDDVMRRYGVLGADVERFPTAAEHMVLST